MTDKKLSEELARLEREYADLFRVDADSLQPCAHRARSGRLFQLTVLIVDLQKRLGYPEVRNN